MLIEPAEIGACGKTVSPSCASIRSGDTPSDSAATCRQDCVHSSELVRAGRNQDATVRLKTDQRSCRKPLCRISFGGHSPAAKERSVAHGARLMGPPAPAEAFGRPR